MHGLSLDAPLVACALSAVLCAAMLSHGMAGPSLAHGCRAAGACAVNCSTYNEQEVSNSLLSFAKLEFVDMDTLEVRPPPFLETSTPSDLCPGWC